MKLLITGSTGQLGNELRRIITSGVAEIGPVASYETVDVTYTAVDSLDISDGKAVSEFILENRFDAVINCAAVTNVDGCETDEDAAYLVNALGPKNLAVACSEVGAKLVQVSTDYVFSGNEPGERLEGDTTGPLSAYGRTKLTGEEFALSCNPKTFVVRTAWLYGYVGGNFVKTMLRLAKERDGMTVVNDQLGNPTSANDLAYTILKLLLTENYGIYHATNTGVCSWADFARAIVSLAGFDSAIVKSCTSEEYAQINPSAAPRPHYSALRNKHLEDTIGNDMRSWQAALATYMDNLSDLKG